MYALLRSRGDGDTARSELHQSMQGMHIGITPSRHTRQVRLEMVVSPPARVPIRTRPTPPPPTAPATTSVPFNYRLATPTTSRPRPSVIVIDDDDDDTMMETLRAKIESQAKIVSAFDMNDEQRRDMNVRLEDKKRRLEECWMKYHADVTDRRRKRYVVVVMRCITIVYLVLLQYYLLSCASYQTMRHVLFLAE